MKIQELAPVILATLVMQACSTTNKESELSRSVYKQAPTGSVPQVYKFQPRYLTTQSALRTKSDRIHEGMSKNQVRDIIGAPDNVNSLWSNHSTWTFNGVKCLVTWGTTGFTYRTTSRGNCSVDFSKDTDSVIGWAFERASGFSSGTYCVENCPPGVATVKLPIKSSNGYRF